MKNKEPKVMISFRIKKENKKRLQDEAKENGYKTYTSYANFILEDYFSVEDKIKEVQQLCYEKK